MVARSSWLHAFESRRARQWRGLSSASWGNCGSRHDRETGRFNIAISGGQFLRFLDNQDNMSALGVDLLWLAVALFLTLLAMLAWLSSRFGRRQAGLPRGEVIYEDMARQSQNQESIFSSELGLVGRPDYLVREKDGSIVPVEVKSGYAPPEPYDGHILQLAAYCLLVEEAYGIRPSHGILQYRDRAFAVDFSYELEGDLLDLLDLMREDTLTEEVFRDHDDPGRCHNCGFVSYCHQSLA